jgi:MFS family permease
MGHTGGTVQKSSLRIYYGWIIVGLSFFTMAFHLTARFSFAIFQVPLIAEFGWTRGALGSVFALMMGLYALLSPFAGSLLDKFGPRAVVPWGSVMVGTGLVGGFFISSLWHAYLLLGMFIGLGTALSGFATHSAILPRWFRQKRGIATGIVLSGIGIGSLFLSPTIERLIAHFGWRIAYLVYGFFVLGILAPLNFIFLRDRPESMGQRLDGLPRPEAEATLPRKAETDEGNSIGQVFFRVKNSKSFWALALLGFIVGFHTNTILSHLQLYLVDTGFSTATGAMIIGLAGLLHVTGSVLIGRISDKVGRPRAQAFSCVIGVLGIVILLSIRHLSHPPMPGFLFSVFYGLGTGGMSAMHSSMAADSFGERSFGTVMGMLTICYAGGGMVGPPMAGFVFDFTTSYFIPFSIVLLLMLSGIFISLFLYEAKANGVSTSGPTRD